MRPMDMKEDEKEFQEWFEGEDYTESHDKNVARIGFLAGWQALREKIKSDPSIGKLVVEDWPESPNY